jgi:hypothetical protein
VDEIVRQIPGNPGEALSIRDVPVHQNFPLGDRVAGALLFQFQSHDSIQNYLVNMFWRT